MDAVSVTIGVVGVLSTVVLGLVAQRLSSTNQRYQARRTIGDLHSSMAHLRCEYPAIKTVCAHWDDLHSRRMYDDADPVAQALLVRYEAYVDIGLEFCNTALGARAKGVLHKDDFVHQYQPLVRLFVAENWPFIRHALGNPYLSAFVRREIQARQAAGFDWQAAHLDITSRSATAPAS